MNEQDLIDQLTEELASFLDETEEELGRPLDEEEEAALTDDFLEGLEDAEEITPQ